MPDTLTIPKEMTAEQAAAFEVLRAAGLAQPVPADVVLRDGTTQEPAPEAGPAFQLAHVTMPQRSAFFALQAGGWVEPMPSVGVCVFRVVAGAAEAHRRALSRRGWWRTWGPVLTNGLMIIEDINDVDAGARTDARGGEGAGVG